MRLSLVWPVVVYMTSIGLPAQEQQSTRMFREWDQNNDGQLIRDELPPNARRNFKRVDSDNDGSISLEEHLQFVTRDRNLPTSASQVPKSVIHHRNIAYAGTDNLRQALDLLVPKRIKAEGPLPLVAFIHGGGWRNGNKDGGVRQVTRFAASGRYFAASIGYRLSGEASWPAQIHDCKAAIRWLRANAKKYQFDPDRICVYGTSAGGHLVAMLGVTGDVKSLEGDLGEYPDQSSRVAAVVDFFGPTNFLTMNDFPGKIDHDSAESPESLLIGGGIQKNRDVAMSAVPVSYISKDDAQILIMHGTKDQLVPFDQSVQFHKLLLRSGVEATLVPIRDGGHGFRGEAIDRRVDDFLMKVFIDPEARVSSEPIEL